MALNDDLAEQFLALCSPELSIRRKAASALGRLARTNWTIEKRSLLTSPEAIKALLAALNDDDSKVVQSVVNTLGMISQRFECNDSAIRDALLAMFDSANSGIRIEIAAAIPQFGSDAVWEVIQETLACRPAKRSGWTVGLAIVRYGKSIAPSRREQLLDGLITSLAKQKNLETIGILLESIGCLGIPRAASEIEKIRPKLTSETAVEALDMALKRLSE